MYFSLTYSMLWQLYALATLFFWKISAAAVWNVIGGGGSGSKFIGLVRLECLSVSGGGVWRRFPGLVIVKDKVRQRQRNDCCASLSLREPTWQTKVKASLNRLHQLHCWTDVKYCTVKTFTGMMWGDIDDCYSTSDPKEVCLPLMHQQHHKHVYRETKLGEW